MLIAQWFSNFSVLKVWVLACPISHMGSLLKVSWAPSKESLIQEVQGRAHEFAFLISNKHIGDALADVLRTTA